uniref:Uncharacterized protein n=1 Tax=Arundo donax TaxID=35708 RepID=A0A0A8Z1Q0_ARUDO
MVEKHARVEMRHVGAHHTAGGGAARHEVGVAHGFHTDLRERRRITRHCCPTEILKELL